MLGKQPIRMAREVCLIVAEEDGSAPDLDDSLKLTCHLGRPPSPSALFPSESTPD